VYKWTITCVLVVQNTKKGTKRIAVIAINVVKTVVKYRVIPRVPLCFRSSEANWREPRRGMVEGLQGCGGAYDVWSRLGAPADDDPAHAPGPSWATASCSDIIKLVQEVRNVCVSSVHLCAGALCSVSSSSCGRGALCLQDVRACRVHVCPTLRPAGARAVAGNDFQILSGCGGQRDRRRGPGHLRVAAGALREHWPRVCGRCREVSGAFGR
jgi:hypothetical protein